ncbi:MAG: DegT/DnrJ/EryC1/StrS family aminotransferase [Pseudolabrys sp.]|nr:DegT/DnrJ/EryC1/StrS family aminotransferase [Pseudolabrys sp.]
MTFEQWRQQAGGTVRFFSLGRHALVEALKVAGVGPGDAVLLPEFICRDVLASLHALGARPVWYAVNESLAPAVQQDAWQAARAVVAVNYFGFPQRLDPFRAYVARTGAVLIEDNAHGFLSRDDDGRWLGTRTEIGIFSLRKSQLLADGAMIRCGMNGFADRLSAPLAEHGGGYAPAVAVKARLRRLPVGGPQVAKAATTAIRLLRQWRSGSSVLGDDAEAERVIPAPAAPHLGLQRELAAFDPEAEIARRRTAYADVEAFARRHGIRPLFPVLGDATVPYGFAFRADDAGRQTMQGWTARRGFDVISWPALPDETAGRVPDALRDIRLVNFL